MTTPGIETTWIGTVLQSPDGPALARFYARLLGWTVHEEDRDWTTVAPDPPAGFNLAFTTEDDYVRPVWPTAPGRPPMMFHLDFEVASLAEAEAHAVACGAEVAGFQPQDDVRVLLDPDGHPFCLYLPPSP